ncbi:MAG: hypothetical protein BWY23_02251 [Spirochaetes bacterium ADurb.Bin218]|jgi:hypothetical protein|nr:MAG: hypothetical protein BWY23_02251 [Spirochaetes bacterium ADurb.Bin218]HOV09387.1 hypothetical protein [Spirochaetota bacterium]
MINWMFYPKSNDIPTHLRAVIDDVFIKNQNSIDSSINQYSSNEILEILRTSVESLGYLIEKDKTSEGKIKVPVLFGLNGSYDKSFDADGYHKELKTVVEVEAGRGVTNYQFLKDLFQACVMHDVDYLIIAIRNIYRDSQDFNKVISFFDTIYASSRLKLPLKGILIVGY